MPGHDLGVHLLFDFDGGASVTVVKDAHAEAARAASDGASDTAEAYDSQSFAPNVGAEELAEARSGPCAGAGERVALDEAAGGGQHDCPGEIGDGFVEHSGGVADGNAALGAGV